MKEKKGNKIAKQRRSQVIVESLIEALTRILKHEPADQTSSNHIAEKAGVSIGSFYQYFKNKNSLLSEVIQQKASKNIEILRAQIFEKPQPGWRPHLEYAVECVFDYFQQEKDFQFRLFSQIYPLNRLDVVAAGREAGRNIFEDILKLHLKPEELKKIDVPLFGFVAVNACMGVIQMYGFDSKELKAEAVKRGIQSLICNDLEASLRMN